MEARRRTTNPILLLTARELKILSQLVEGKSYGQIAANLLISYKTVANTYSRIKAKLGARSLPDLMQIAMLHLPSTLDAKIAPKPSLARQATPRKPGPPLVAGRRRSRGAIRLDRGLRDFLPTKPGGFCRKQTVP